MWRLIHLPTSTVVSYDQFKETMEDILESCFFYEDPTDHSISYDMYENGDLEMVHLDPWTHQVIHEYWLISLNKCEFEIVEFELCGK